MATKTSSSIKTTTNLQTGSTQSFRTSYKTRTGLSSIARIQMIGISIIVLGIGSTVDNFSVEDLVETTPNYNVINDFIPIDDPLNTINYSQYGQEVFDNLFNEQSGYIAVLKDLVETGENVSACLTDITQCLTNVLFSNQEDLEEINNPDIGTFTDEFGSERIKYLRTWYVLGGSTPYVLYEQLTSEEKEFLRDYTGTYMEAEKVFLIDWSPTKFYFFGFENPFNNDIWQWGYFKWPNVLDTIDELGV
jgi:hypothetical protein